MIADATLPLQAAIVAALKADSGVAALLGDRIYDRPPPGAAKPYLSIGPMQSLPELADDYEGAQTTMQLDIWSDAPTTVESKQIGSTVHAALHGADLVLTDHRLISFEIEQTRYLTDPDGLTQHAVMIFNARTEPMI